MLLVGFRVRFHKVWACDKTSEPRWETEGLRVYCIRIYIYINNKDFKGIILVPYTLIILKTRME